MNAINAHRLAMAAILAAEAAIPDLPEGWTRGGPLTVLILVVLLFLGFMLIVLRVLSKRESEHADRVSSLARELTENHGQALDRQIANCKEEMANTIGGYRGQVDLVHQQNQRLIELLDRKLSKHDGTE